MKNFTYYQPTTVEQAVGLLSDALESLVNQYVQLDANLAARLRNATQAAGR